MQNSSNRILIAEDDALVASVIEDELEKVGSTVIGKASDGLRAIELTKNLHPDVVLMDIEMPEMNGIEASQEIQKVCPTPIVVLTVYNTTDLTIQAAAAGVGAYLTKPPRANELSRAITIARARFNDMRELVRLNRELQDALSKVKTLSGLIPICANCKKIRDIQGNWHQIEKYIQSHSHANFTHGICPECVKVLYPEIGIPYNKPNGPV